MTYQENESKIKFEFLVILAPSPLILILILSVMGSKSLFCFRKSEICILNTVSTEVTLAPSNLAFSGSILHILFSSSRHCLTFTCGHQKRFTNVWTRINLETDKYLSFFKFIRIRVDGALDILTIKINMHYLRHWVSLQTCNQLKFKSTHHALATLLTRNLSKEDKRLEMVLRETTVSKKNFKEADFVKEKYAM